MNEIEVQGTQEVPSQDDAIFELTEEELAHVVAAGGGRKNSNAA